MERVVSSTLGVEMILRREDVDVNKCNPASLTARKGSPDLFKLVVQHQYYKIGHINTLFEFLLNATFENSHFKCSEVTLETVRILLQKGADPNYPPGLLAYAVNFLPFDVCKLLLDHEANPDSSFLNEHMKKIVRYPSYLF